jgi:GT2 family glycosyltransferase
MVSIIILSYNTKDLLEICLGSVASVGNKSDYEIIVLDNASSDESAKMVKSKFPGVIYIQNEKNDGFAKGNNIAASKATGDYLLFLNSDAILQKETIFSLVRSFTDERTGVVGGLLSNNDGTIQRSYGSYYHLKEVFRMLFGGDKSEMSKDIPKNIAEVDWVNGGCMMVRRDVFEKLGGFDEHFFMYIEDMEFCYRATLVGYKVLINPHVKVFHKGQGSSNRSFAIKHIFSGLRYFYKKHKSPFDYALLMVLLHLKRLVALIIGKATSNSYLIKTYQHAL